MLRAGVLKWVPVVGMLLLLGGPMGVFAQEADNVGGGLARMRVGQFLPDVAGADIYVNGELTLEGVTFPTLSQWLEFEPGLLNITVTAAEGTVDEAIIGPFDLEAAANGWYTAAAVGIAEQDTAFIQVLEEDYSPITLGETRITVFNAVPQGRPVTLFTGDLQLVAGLSFPGTQGDNDGAVTEDILAENYDLQLVDSIDEDEILFTSENTQLGTNRHYFIAAIGFNTRPTGLFATTDLSEFAPAIAEETEGAVGVARLRWGHFASEHGPLELYLNGERANIPVTGPVGLTDWIRVPADVYEVSFSQEGETYDDAVVTPFNVTLAAETWSTIAVVSLEGGNELLARRIEEDYSPIPRGESRITLLHAAPDAPPVDMVLNDQVYAAALDFAGRLPTEADGAISVTLGAGMYDFEVTEAGEINNGFLNLLDTQLVPGNHYFIALVNRNDLVEYYLQAVTQEAVVGSLE
jgi:hypothetical protein